jgi:hypothetical protein
VLTSHDDRTEFLRQVYDEGGASEATRQTYVSAYRAPALDAVRDGGNVTNSASNAVSVGMSVPKNWTPSQVTELARWSRNYLSAATITLALAEVPGRVRRHQTNVTNLRVLG